MCFVSQNFDFNWTKQPAEKMQKNLIQVLKAFCELRLYAEILRHVLSLTSIASSVPGIKSFTQLIFQTKRFVAPIFGKMRCDFSLFSDIIPLFREIWTVTQAKAFQGMLFIAFNDTNHKRNGKIGASSAHNREDRVFTFRKRNSCVRCFLWFIYDNISLQQEKLLHRIFHLPLLNELLKPKEEWREEATVGGVKMIVARKHFDEAESLSNRL